MTNKQTYNTIPPIFEMTGRIMACQPNLAFEQLIDVLKEDERLRTLLTLSPRTHPPGCRNKERSLPR